MSFINVLAHEGEELVEQVLPRLDEVIRTNSINYTILALVSLIVLTILSVILKKRQFLKTFLFFGFVVVIIFNSAYLIGSTLYLNTQSVTGGPIHYHADFEIYNCGEYIDIKNPKGFSNKIGSSVIHEHGDNRIHLEGVLLDKHDASLGHFFAEIGGSMDENRLTIPTNQGEITLQNGKLCDGRPAAFQVFVYQTRGNYYYQEKLENSPQNYVISPQSSIPPGDCVIIELDYLKKRTDKLCEQYLLKENLGEIKNGN
jgi:hypothetical protein